MSAVLEIATFRICADEAAFRATVLRTARFLRTCPGFVSRRLADRGAGGRLSSWYSGSWSYLELSPLAGSSYTFRKICRHWTRCKTTNRVWSPKSIPAINSSSVSFSLNVAS